MKVIVTGAEGQLGCALQATTPVDVELVGLGHSALDIASDASITRVAALDPDVIINAAAYTAVDNAESEQEQAFAVNATGAGHMAKAARELNARLVHISTDFVFDGTQGRPYQPSDVPNPLNVYGASKLAGEQAVQAELQNALILRAAWVYHSEGRNFVQTMLRLMRKRTVIEVVDDQVSTPTSAESLARAIWRSLDVNATGILHWTDAGVASWFDFAVAIHNLGIELSLLARPVRIQPIGSQSLPRPARRPTYSVLDKRDAYARLGYAEHWCMVLKDVLQRLLDIEILIQGEVHARRS